MHKKNDNILVSKLFYSNVSSYLVIIFLCATVSLFFGNMYIALGEFIVLAGLLVFDFLRKAKKNKQIIDYMQNLTFHVDTAAKDSLLHFPMPMTVLKIDGTISWYNKSFQELFTKREQLFEMHIQDLIQDMNWFELIKSASGICIDINIEDRKYQMLGNVVKTQKKGEKDSYLVLLYWIERTKLYELEKECRDEKSNVAIFMIDNYEEVANNIDDMTRPQVLGQIDKLVREWLAGTDGILKKVDRDRYIYIFANKHMKKFEGNRFSVLKTVRESSIGFEMKTPFTMSVGIGIGGQSILENETFAKRSLDMAMGRGGDQAVIKECENFRYYGGESNEYEKNTRVKTKMFAQAFRELAVSMDNIVVMGHVNPDMDSFGASIGIYRAALSLGKTAYIVNDSKSSDITAATNRFSSISEYQNAFISCEDSFEVVTEKTLLVVVDVHKPSFTQVPKLLSKTKNVVLIDHHRRGAEFIENTSLVYHEPYASSTCEMVAEMLQYIGSNVKLTKLEAESLYSGIVVDTKNFSFKTGVKTFEAASFLKRYGVDTIVIKKLFQTNIEDYRKRASIVSNAEIIFKKIAISSCDFSDMPKAQLGIVTAQAADELLDITGICASFVLCLIEQTVVISARAMGDINVQVILEKLGGGGHRDGAGAQLKNTTLAEAKDKLTDEIKQYLDISK